MTAGFEHDLWLLIFEKIDNTIPFQLWKTIALYWMTFFRNLNFSKHFSFHKSRSPQSDLLLRKHLTDYWKYFVWLLNILKIYLLEFPISRFEIFRFSFFFNLVSSSQSKPFSVLVFSFSLDGNIRTKSPPPKILIDEIDLWSSG